MSRPGDTSERPRPRAATLWPREHGAYVQLLGPLATALLFVRPTVASVAFAAAACALFVCHEPCMILLGRRGVRAQSADGERARTRLVLMLWLAVVCLLVALANVSPAVHVALWPPIVLSVVAGALLLEDLETGLAGEVLQGLTLASFSLPVLMASGVPLRAAALLATGWGLVHSLATVTARAAVRRRRQGPRALVQASALSALVFGVVLLLRWYGAVPLALSLAPLPVVLITFALASGLFRPRTPKPVGWALAGAAAIAVVLFGVGLRSLI